VEASDPLTQLLVIEVRAGDRLGGDELARIAIAAERDLVPVGRVSE
jgi:hypothetical protein